MSLETINPRPESKAELKIEEAVTLIEKNDLERLQKLAIICGIDLIYVGENENLADEAGNPLNYQNLVISELPQTTEDELKIAARAYSINLNNGMYNVQDADNAVRVKRQKAKLFVSIKTCNEDITFDEFNLLFFVLREKGSDNINNKLQMDKTIHSKLIKNKAEKKKKEKEQREKEQRETTKLDIKAPINNLIKVDHDYVEEEDVVIQFLEEVDNQEDVIMPTTEELEGKI